MYIIATGNIRIWFAAIGARLMRAIVIVVALVVVLGIAYMADSYCCGGSYSHMVLHSLGQVIAVLVNNW